MSGPPRTLNLPLGRIRTDPRCQSRARLREDTAEEYADVLRAGGVLPRPVVFWDGTAYWLAAGHHRLRAYELAGLKTMIVDVVDGDLRDAILYAVGSNATHGLRPDPDDKRRAVGILLDDPEWAAWSAAEIARRCGVSAHLVLTMRRERASPPETGMRAVQASRAGTTYTMRLPDPPEVPDAIESAEEQARANDLEDACSALAIAAECLGRLGPAYAVALERARAAVAAVAASGGGAAA